MIIKLFAKLSYHYNTIIILRQLKFYFGNSLKARFRGLPLQIFTKIFFKCIKNGGLPRPPL
ncbi:MAG: hypothetical protein ACD_28C00199G0002 [uncultured bacterium]|nr:MAG: hypothetical protein ACD_28C00199G0002 [uncultured bacterium]